MSSGYELEVTLTSAKDLKNVNWRNGPTRPYAVVWVDSDRKVTTRVDEEGDDSPNWNEKFVLPLSGPVDGDTTLYIDIVHAKNSDEDTKPLIGSAKIQLNEILDEAGGYDASATQKLKLKRPSGRPQGKVNIETIIHDRRYRYSAPPPSHEYGVRGYGDAPPPAPGQYGYAYSAPAPPPPQYNQYGSTPAGYSGYGGAPPQQPGYGEPAPQQYYGQQPEPDKKSRFGMGTGMAVGAAAGLAGGVALAVGYDALTDKIADDAADKVEERGGDDDDDGEYGGYDGDDY